MLKDMEQCNDMEKTRILFLSDSDISKVGGAQQSMKVIENSLKSEFDFYIIAPQGKKVSDKHIVLDDYYNFRIRGKGPLKLLKLVKDIYLQIKEINPDIIHLQMNSTVVILNFLIKMRLLSKNIKIVFTDRGVYNRYGKLTKLSIDSLIPIAQNIITTTEANRQNYHNHFKDYDRYKEKFLIINNTAGEQFDMYDELKSEKVRENIKVRDDDLVIGFCGRFSEQKNWPLAKEIIKKLYNRIKNIKFVLILGTDGSDATDQRIKQFITEIDQFAGSNVQVFINLSNQEVSELYYAFDIFILTSKWESFGRTAVEAMSRRNIVLGTDVDGLSEVIGDKKYLYKTSEEAAKIVESICANEMSKLLSTKYFYERYHSTFGTMSNIAAYQKVYRNLLN